MKYETPELTAVTAINAIQSSSTTGKNFITGPLDTSVQNDSSGSYTDWE